MEFEITFKINCGKETCGTGSGQFCRFLHLTLNQKDYCHLFGKVYDVNGWIQRHPDCIKEAKKEVNDK